ncbi:MAG TPA: hypothetical protein VM536_19880 [Chloroflexia bacterium]|nr:hypothetical protein [Chloroflexia bacterium]
MPWRAWGLFGLLAVCLTLSGPAAPTQAADGNVGLMVDNGAGGVATYCLSVPAAGVSGLELLQRTGLPLRIDAVSLGVEVCAIGGVGCLDASQPCYCQCQGTPCVFWRYVQWRNGRWVSTTLGAASTVVRPGSIEGWGWGKDPPAPSGNALCATQAAPTAPPSAPTRPPATRTPRPAPTPVPATRRPSPRPPTATRVPPSPAAIPAPPSPSAPASLPATATSILPTETAVPTVTEAPTATTPPTQTRAPSPPPAPSATAVPSNTPTAPGASPTRTPGASGATPNSGPPPSYWVFGLMAAGLLGIIGWARWAGRATSKPAR